MRVRAHDRAAGTPDSNLRADSDGHGTPGVHADAGAHSLPNADRCGCPNAGCYAHSIAIPDSGANRHARVNACSLANRYVYSHGDAHPCADRYTHTGAYAYSKTDPYPDTNSDPDAGGTGGSAPIRHCSVVC